MNKPKAKRKFRVSARAPSCARPEALLLCLSLFAMKSGGIGVSWREFLRGLLAAICDLRGFDPAASHICRFH